MAEKTIKVDLLNTEKVKGVIADFVSLIDISYRCSDSGTITNYAIDLRNKYPEFHPNTKRENNRKKAEDE